MVSLPIGNYSLDGLIGSPEEDNVAERVVVILVATVTSFMVAFIFSMFCVVKKCRQKRQYPDTQPLKKRVVVMRSNILYADSKMDQNSQVKHMKEKAIVFKF